MKKWIRIESFEHDPEKSVMFTREKLVFKDFTVSKRWISPSFNGDFTDVFIGI